jgi:hypothetical protein
LGQVPNGSVPARNFLKDFLGQVKLKENLAIFKQTSARYQSQREWRCQTLFGEARVRWRCQTLLAMPETSPWDRAG